MSEEVNIYQAIQDDGPLVEVTQAALNHIKKHIAKRGHGIGIRLSVKQAGCSGMQYVLDYVDAAEAGDKKQVIDETVSVFVNDYSLPFVKGVIIDFVQEGINQKFKFTNPNEKGSCGCGESFQV